MSEKEKLLGTLETAQRLGVSRTTLFTLMEEGVIKPVPSDNPLLKRPRRLQFREEDVERVLRGEVKRPNTPPKGEA